MLSRQQKATPGRPSQARTSGPPRGLRHWHTVQFCDMGTWETLYALREEYGQQAEEVRRPNGGRESDTLRSTNEAG